LKAKLVDSCNSKYCIFRFPERRIIPLTEQEIDQILFGSDSDDELLSESEDKMWIPETKSCVAEDDEDADDFIQEDANDIIQETAVEPVTDTQKTQGRKR
jgi:hypothetical protein